MTPDPRFPASPDDSTSGNPAQLRRSAANSISADANGAKSSSMDTSSSTRMPVQPVERSVSPAQLSPQDDFAASSSVQPYAPRLAPQRQPLPVTLLILLALVLMLVGLTVDNFWMGLAGAGVAMLLSLQILWVTGSRAINELLSVQERRIIVSILGVTLAGIGLLRLSGWGNRFLPWYQNLNWEAIGALGEVFGAVGQILIAILAVYIAWRQYVISKDLTIQQNIITQQQTIDSYFQGISELVLDEEGLLEDWPQERAVAEGRTAAILSSIDASGKAKVLRFLSRSRLLTPLKRDRRLGRAILDGTGGYAEDRNYGVRVIDLGVMLAGTDLSGTDLRWTDLSDINLIRANLRNCDLVKTNFARTILCEASLAGSDMMGTRLFYGPVATASPRTRADIPDYTTGAHTGAVIEGADLTGVQRLSEEQRYYCCAWGGSATRATIPGGCDGIPNLLER
ncbi:pentapeptide repeat-containing protein [Leptolyngbya sp. NK1-12]|uniref:Pentapeptide repeat-containing protein n=1 Tax=Leptolyngbya sp. NK1-12 TaxID=2547451 RepID=A0AA96WLA8_9CYAN|nr:pentapeptide repeat-containing protein [Leptolyngbya sp. NK1-12]WNZ24336.1 pentapeptide repeat-containing protein [Leptolyngbya sp. NK1-12]